MKETNKQAVSWHHVFRVQRSPRPPTLWGASRTPSSPPSWGTHAPHRTPSSNGWTTSVILPVHETQNGPHQWCIHLSLWWPLCQMVSAIKVLFCLMSWIARCPFTFFFFGLNHLSFLTDIFFCEMKSFVKFEYIHLFSAFKLMGPSKPMIWFMYTCMFWLMDKRLHLVLLLDNWQEIWCKIQLNSCTKISIHLYSIINRWMEIF